MNIPFSVIALHILFVFALLYFHPKTSEKKKHVRIRVNQVQSMAMEVKEHPPIQPIVSLPEKIEPELAAPQECEPEKPSEIVEETVKDTPIQEKSIAEVKKEEKNTLAAPKKEVAKKSEPKKSPPKPKVATASKKAPVSKKPTVTKKAETKTTPNRDKLYALMQESLKTLDKSKTSGTGSKPGLATAKGSSSLPQLASETLKFEASYQESLISLLEERLQFPEKGNVKIKLTLKKEGTFKNVEIVNSASDKNAKYVQSVLPDMVFPSLQKFFPKEESHTFLITLTAEKSRFRS